MVRVGIHTASLCNSPCIALHSTAEEAKEENRMAMCAAAVGLKSMPTFTKLQGSSPTTANTHCNCRPPLAFSNMKGRCYGNGNSSMCKIVNSRGSEIQRKEEGVVMGRRQAMGLMGMGISWATSAMAMATTNANPNPTDDEKDEDGKILESAPLTFNVGKLVKKEGEEVVLAMSVRVPRAELCGFNAFINLPDAQSDTPVTCPQFAGKFFHEPHSLPNNPFMHTQWRIGISDIIDELGLWQSGNVLVTIVPTPATLPAPILIKAVTLEFESL